MAAKKKCPHCGEMFAAQGFKAHVAMKHDGATPPVAHRADQVAKSGAAEPVPSEEGGAVANDLEAAPGAPDPDPDPSGQADPDPDPRSDYEREMGY